MSVFTLSRTTALTPVGNQLLFIAILFLTALVTAGMATPLQASEPLSLAMAETPPITKVVVRKEERRLYLMSYGEVVRSYRISLGQSPVGHKLYEGDSRTPEGRYILDYRNPNSDFYKSIRVSYPNAKDRSLAKAWGLNPGGNIMIHGLPNDVGDMGFAYLGLDWTDGCIAVSNEQMDEIWQLVDMGTPIQILP